MSDNLIIYYSRRGENYVGGKICHLEKGNAELLSEYIQDAAQADIFEIQTAEEYPADYMTCTEVAKKEADHKARPELKAYLDSIGSYQNIFIVGPCWWGTYPMAMFSQLERLDFTEKKVLPVMTHEGSGMGSSEKDLKKLCKGAKKVVKGLAIAGSAVPGSRGKVEKWVKKNI